jgi:regulatory protein
LTAHEVLGKARRYCDAQERCHQQVRDKLYAWGCLQDEVEQLIARLIGEGLLNEHRYAEDYAVSKFRQKGWGRVKIRMALRLKKVSMPCINAGLAAIDDEAYLAFLADAVAMLRTRTKGRNAWEREQRVKRYLMGRGFEPELIADALNRA